MKKIFGTLFLCIFILSSCTYEPVSVHSLYEEREADVVRKGEIPPDFIPKTFAIVSLGDSLTKGVGDSTNRGGYLPYLEQLLLGEKGVKRVNFANYGVSGNRSPQLLKRLTNEEVKEDVAAADLVIITIGGNDMMKVVRENFLHLEMQAFTEEQKKFANNLQAIIEQIRAENPHTYICLVGLYNPFYQYFSEIKELDVILENWNKASQAVLAQYEHTYFVEIATSFKQSEENLLFTDYFHPNDKGYELIAKEVYSELHSHALKTLTAFKNESAKKGFTTDE